MVVSLIPNFNFKGNLNHLFVRSIQQSPETPHISHVSLHHLLFSITTIRSIPSVQRNFPLPVPRSLSILGSCNGVFFVYIWTEITLFVESII